MEAWKSYTKFHTQHKVKGQLANAQSSLHYASAKCALKTLCVLGETMTE